MRFLEFTPDFCHRSRKCGLHHRENLNSWEISVIGGGWRGSVRKDNRAERREGWSVGFSMTETVRDGGAQDEAWRLDRRGIP
jgi:hypothetical protein